MNWSGGWHSLMRYRPYAVVAIAALAIVYFPSADRSGRAGTTTGAGVSGAPGTPARQSAAIDALDTGVGGGEPGGPSTVVPGQGQPSAPSGQGAAGIGPGEAVAGSGIGSAAALAAPDCDAAAKHLRVASVYAPPCVVPWPEGADNGGETTQGVTATTIKVVAIHTPQQTPAQDAQEAASFADYATMFEDLFRTWGRHVETVWFNVTGSDEAAQRADAIKIAAMKPFAAISAGVSLNYDTLAEELASRRVVVCCYTAITLTRAKALAPYLWGGTLGSPEAYALNLAQYAGRRLLGQNAHWAGQAEYQASPRKFGLVYPDTWSDLSVFTDEFAKYGGALTVAVEYPYASAQYPSYQEHARTIVARMKEAGVTTVLDVGGLVLDPILTKTATSQQWFPEWVLAGTGGQDLDVVGRLNDPAQWRNAFGLSTMAIGGDLPVPQDQLYEWYWGPDRGTRSTVFAGTTVLYSGIHGAGPNLTPATFRDGLFATPPAGGAASGGMMGTQVSFGSHGFYPWDDYNAWDDFAEVWWDPSARGKDILTCSQGACAQGVGKYRFLNGGKRYAPFQWPTDEPKFFDTEGTALWYSEYPAGDTPPSYPCTGCPSQGG